MKKNIRPLISMALVLILTGCGSVSSSDKSFGNKPTGVSDIMNQKMSEANNVQTSVVAKEKNSSNTSAHKIPDHVDTDLSKLSSTMAYVEIGNICNNADNYKGKVIKIKGTFSYTFDQSTGKYYFACFVQDATACCSRGVEFELAGEHTFPDDYPNVDDEICVIGTFDTYKEGTHTYCTLRDAFLI